MKEFLSWLCLCGGTVILGAAVALIIAWIERRRERRRDIYYLYAEHIEKSSDRRRHQEDINRCVCCGKIIPEGRPLCPDCKSKLSDDMSNIVRNYNYIDTDIIYSICRRNK